MCLTGKILGHHSRSTCYPYIRVLEWEASAWSTGLQRKHASKGQGQSDDVTPRGVSAV